MIEFKLLDENITMAHGCKEPDEVFITDRHIFILEKKTQSRSGTTVEKLQAAVFKKEHYSDLYPKHKIIYIFCLSP